jgi:hypothetical protein
MRRHPEVRALARLEGSQQAHRAPPPFEASAALLHLRVTAVCDPVQANRSTDANRGTLVDFGFSEISLDGGVKSAL